MIAEIERARRRAGPSGYVCRAVDHDYDLVGNWCKRCGLSAETISAMGARQPGDTRADVEERQKENVRASRKHVGR